MNIDFLLLNLVTNSYMILKSICSDTFVNYNFKIADKVIYNCIKYQIVDIVYDINSDDITLKVYLKES